MSFTADWGKLTENGLKQGGLTQTVSTYYGDLLTSFQSKGNRLGQRIFLIVTQNQIFGFDYEAARCSGHKKVEFRLDFFCWSLEYFHFVKLFLTGVCHAAGGHTCLVAGDKVLKLFDFSLLTLVSSLLLSLLNFVHAQEVVVVAGVAGQIAAVKVVDYVDYGIEELNVMGYQDEGVFVLLKESGKPDDVLVVQIVGRLVQNEDGRVFQKKLNKQNLGSLSAGEVGNILVKSYVAKSKASGYFFNLCIQLIKTAVL